VPVSVRKGGISNSLCNLHLNFIINWQYGILFVTIDVECIVLIWKWLFVTTLISQGSVATRLRCGGQCDSQFVANFLANSTMEKFRKSVNICQSYGQKYRGPFFDSQCIYDVYIYTYDYNWPPIGNYILRVQWSRDLWPHVTPVGGQL